MNKKIIILLCSLLLVFILFYFVFIKEDKNNSNKNSNNSNSSNTTNVVESITYDEEEIDFSGYEEVTIDLNNENKIYSITKGGVYHFKGNLNGYIKVDTEDEVKIILDNVTITNTSGPCIYGVNSEKLYIELVGENTLTDGSTYSGIDEEVKSVVFSNDDLIFSGDGSLTINANYNDGISGDDDVEFISGTYVIKSADDAIRGKDSVVVTNGTFTIDAGGDGIKSTNDTDADKGYILIKNGTFNITSVNDGIDASTNVEIDNGKFTIKTTGNTSTDSAKGIKANGNILIKNGTIDIDSTDDSIHSNGTIEITSGTININSDDDGVHADGMILINGGTFNINAHEGIEATYIKINDGTINIDASDDGINAANKSTDYSVSVEINGGNITIKMGAGDTDAIDSNGNIYINGGTINITAQSPFDYDGEAKYNGGTIIVNGQTTNTITNQMMGGGMPNGNMQNRGRTGNDTAMRGNMNGRGRM